MNKKVIELICKVGIAVLTLIASYFGASAAVHGVF